MATKDPNNLIDNVVPVPTLSTLNLIYDSANKFDQLLAHMFVADANQTYLYPGHVTSIPQLIEKGGSRRDTLEQSLRQGFYDYFNRYYQDVSVTVTIREIDFSSSRLDFDLNVTVSERQEQADFGRLIRTAHKQLVEIIKINNYG